MFYESEFLMTALIFGPPIGAPGTGQISRHHQVCEQSKKNIRFLQFFEKSEFPVTARILAAKFGVPRGRPESA